MAFYLAGTRNWVHFEVVEVLWLIDVFVAAGWRVNDLSFFVPLTTYSQCRQILCCLLLLALLPRRTKYFLSIFTQPSSFLISALRHHALARVLLRLAASCLPFQLLYITFLQHLKPISLSLPLLIEVLPPCLLLRLGDFKLIVNDLLGLYKFQVISVYFGHFWIGQLA